MFDCLGKTKHNRKKKEEVEKKKGQRRRKEEEKKEEAGCLDLNLGCLIYIICFFFSFLFCTFISTQACFLRTEP